MAEADALRAREGAISALRKTVFMLQANVAQENERRVTNTLKLLERDWEAVQSLHEIYLKSINATATDADHGDDLKNAFDAFVGGKESAEDFLWKKEEEHNALVQDARKKKMAEAKLKELISLKKNILQFIRDFETTTTIVGNLLSPDSSVIALKVQYERYKNEYEYIVGCYKKYMLEEEGVIEDRDEIAGAVEKTKIKFLQTETNILSFMDNAKSISDEQSKPVTPVEQKIPTISAQQKPDIKIKRLLVPKFNGSIKEYAAFKRDFTNIMEGVGYNKTHLAYQLKYESLPEEARILVKNLDVYEEVWKRLDEEYGDVGELVSLVVREIEQLKIVDDNDDKGVVNLVNVIEQGYQDLKCIGKEDHLANVLTLRTIESKMPKYILRDWWRAAKKYDDLADAGDYLSKLRDLIGFLNEERTRAKKSLRADSERTSKYIKFRGVNNMVSGTVDPIYDPCWMAGCTKDHKTRNCPKFKSLQREEKGLAVLNAGACEFCLGLHPQKECIMKSYWNPCDRNGCNKYHSRLLHGCKTLGLNLHVQTKCVSNPMSKFNKNEGSALLLLQDIKFITDIHAKVFWDNGSTTCLIRHSFAKKQGLTAIPVTYSLTTVGGETKEYETELYAVKLCDRKGRCHVIKAYGIDEISTKVEALKSSDIPDVFPGLKPEDVVRTAGSIDILIGMEHAGLQPWKIKTVGNLVLYQSYFGTGKIVGGLSSQVSQGHVKPQVHFIAKCSISNVKLRELKETGPDFFSSEEFGVHVPPRCKSCKSCKDCAFQTNQMSYIEQQELQVIKEKMKLDDVNKRWIAGYPWKADPRVLGDNYQQAERMLYSLEKRLLKSPDIMAKFMGQIEDFRKRGILKKIGEEERQNWHGPVHYLSLHEVYKDDKTSTTPVRLVVNSALRFKGRSLNSILMKGPSSLNDIFSVLIRFRFYLVGLVGDVAKMYQSVGVNELEQHTRRILWRECESHCKPDTYVLTTVTYGDVCAGCIAAVALRNTATVYNYIDPQAAQKLIEDTYVDDVTTGANSMMEAERLRDNMIKIGKEGGFHFKEWIMSGDGSKSIDILGSGTFNKVLGCAWDTAADLWKFKARVNHFGKYKGSREGPDLQKYEIASMLPKPLTKRIVLRLINTVYDPLGLIVPFTINLKLQMRKLYLGECAKLGWDSPIPDEHRETWVIILQQMFEVEDISFIRCVQPKDRDPNVLPKLITFSDGSVNAFCACTYVHWKLMNGKYRGVLVCAKARVGPINKISIPRMELQGAVLNSRLHQKVKESLNMEFQEEIHIIDSGAVKDMITRESTSCKEFVGTRVGEIRSRSMVSEWAWVQSKDNPADLGTRGSNPLRLSEKSMWQNGPQWMELLTENWPIDFDYKEPIPPEELITIQQVNMVKRNKYSTEIIDINRFNSLTKLLRVTAIVLKIASTKKLQIDAITSKDLHLAQIYWERDAMKTTLEAYDKGRLRSLRAVKNPDGLIVISGRAGKLMTIGYDRESLVVLMPTHRYAKLYLKSVHEGELDIEHNGVLADLSKSREKYWIPQAKRILKQIRRKCFKCRLLNKRLEKQIMAPLPATRLKPSPVWYTTSLDLFGPLQIVDSIKKRTTGKCWGLIASCTVTRCTHLDITENYSTDSMIMALRRFLADRGCVNEFQSDRGTQLKASAKEIVDEVEGWAWDNPQFLKWAESKGIKWTFCPVAAPHMNGCSEALIRITKRMLNEILRNKKFTYGELTTVIKEVQQLINSRPIGISESADDPTAGDLLTCNHLLMGRASAKIPQGPFDTTNKLTKRFKFVQETVDEWWKKWFLMVFPSLVPSYKWHKKYRNISVGDVVLMKDESAHRGDYRIGRVCETKTGIDGNVRRAVVQYKICDGSRTKFTKEFKRTERPIHNLCVIVPVEYKEEDMI